MVLRQECQRHTAHIAHLIRQAKRNQRSLVVTLLDLRNAFGAVHHNLIPVVLAHHHIPDNIIKAIMSVYEDFASTIAIDSFTTPFPNIKNLFVYFIFIYPRIQKKKK